MGGGPGAAGIARAEGMGGRNGRTVTWGGTADEGGGRGRREWRGGRGYGAPIDLRGIRHAPVNELGVVALFGALAEELGYLIEAVRVRFPDCEAKRLVDARTGRWEKCRIEFEF